MSFVYELPYAVCNGRKSGCCQIEFGFTYLLSCPLWERSCLLGYGPACNVFLVLVISVYITCGSSKTNTGEVIQILSSAKLMLKSIHSKIKVRHRPLRPKNWYIGITRPTLKLQMLLFPNTLCCSLYECNCVCAVTKIFTKFLPTNNFCQLLQVTRKHSCTSAGKAQAQLHFQDDNRGRLELATSPIRPDRGLFSKGGKIQ